MVTLHVHFREGWHHHDVSLSVGAEEWHGEDITTRRQVGLARQVTFQVPAGKVEMAVSVGGGETSVRKSLDLREEYWVGISLSADGSLEIREQASEFGYV